MQENPILKHPQSRKIIWALIAGSLLLHFFFTLINETIFSEIRWEHHPVHASIEIAGSLIAFWVSWVLLKLEKSGKGSSFNIIIAIALLTMGMFDLFHALTHSGNLFVWFHSIAVFAGGLLMHAIWWNRFIESHFQRWGVQTVFTIATTTGLISLLYPESIPVMLVQQPEGLPAFSPVASVLNLAGGGFFLLGGVRLLLSYKATGNYDDLLFSLHCFLFGAAAIMFQYSELWDVAWWGWHVLRFAAYAVALWLVLKTEIRLFELIKKTNQQLEQRVRSRSYQLEQLETALNDHALVTVLNPHGILVDANEKHREVSGFTKNELVGQPLTDLVRERHAGELNRQIWQGIIDHGIWQGEISQRSKDDGTYWVQGTFVPFRNFQGEIERVVSIQTDITSQKLLEQSLLKAINTKDEFMATMSHELRTPLTAILGFCGELLPEITDPKQRENLKQIHIAGENQLTLVNDILDMSKIESGKFTIEEIHYSLPQLIEEIRGMLIGKIKEKGLTLQTENRYTKTNLLIGDRQRIKQILINLIGNALKFTEKGAITLTVEQTGEQLQFIVSDTGIGIQPENMEKLFRRFQQEDGSICRRFGGSGLGLFISLNLAEHMGGTVTARSTYGEGSRFTLSLPYQPGGQPKAESTTEATTGETGKKLHLSGKVLLAEDTAAIQLLIRRMLEKVGITVTSVNNGRKAVEEIRKNEYDLILMDMQMPEMDGIEAFSVIRQQGYQMPVIAVTANVMQKHREQFETAGCNDFIGKPIEKESLMNVLKKHLHATE